MRTRRFSRIHVELLSTQAFQYRWNCSSLVGFDVTLRHVSVSRPVSVRVRGLRVTSIW
ncbi:MAG: hypothetical protein QM736_23435 [Vicinamibacterales bacterium]